MEDTPVPVIVIDDTPVKRRGICEFVEETPQLCLYAQAGDTDSIIALIEKLCMEKAGQNPILEGWLVLSDLHLGPGNGIGLGRSLLRLAPGLRIVIYTQDPSWTLAAEIFRQEYTRGGTSRSDSKRAKKQPGLHGYALFSNMQPSYLEHIATAVVRTSSSDVHRSRGAELSAQETARPAAHGAPGGMRLTHRVRPEQ